MNASKKNSGDEAPPSWVKELLQRPLVEIRRGLSWGYDPPSEQHSVVVLTAPSGKYVDIRFPLTPGGQYIGVKPSEVFSGYATAGLSIVHMPTGTETCPPYECTAHIRWEHPIDSTREFATDGADMYLLSNGDVMEVGIMSLKGEVKMFKEYWLQAPKLDPTKPSSFLVLETVTASPDAGKGMMVKIDNYCQGILQTASEFWVERWEQAELDGEWVKDSRSHSVSGEEEGRLPCEWAIAAETTAKLGDRLTVNGREWEVVEVGS